MKKSALYIALFLGFMTLASCGRPAYVGTTYPAYPYGYSPYAYGYSPYVYGPVRPVPHYGWGYHRGYRGGNYNRGYERHQGYRSTPRGGYSNHPRGR